MVVRSTTPAAPSRSTALSAAEKRELRENVERGAALLDRRRPRWFEQIDLDEFYLESATACICGQLSGLGRRSYYARVLARRPNPSDDWLHRHGFFVDGERIVHEDAWPYAENHWRKLIKQRRRAAS